MPIARRFCATHLLLRRCSKEGEQSGLALPGATDKPHKPLRLFSSGQTPVRHLIAGLLFDPGLWRTFASLWLWPCMTHIASTIIQSRTTFLSHLIFLRHSHRITSPSSSGRRRFGCPLGLES